jgi:hypothetical protein
LSIVKTTVAWVGNDGWRHVHRIVRTRDDAQFAAVSSARRRTGSGRSRAPHVHEIALRMFISVFSIGHVVVSPVRFSSAVAARSLAIPV